MLELPEEWDYEPVQVPQPQPVQTRAQLLWGPFDGEWRDIGRVDELAEHIGLHTREFLHYYALGNLGGRWVYMHHSVERRRCGR